MFSSTCSVACEALQDPSSKSDQRWHAYRVLLDSLEPREHVWCQYADYARFLCGLLEFPGSDLWKRFQLVLKSTTCHSCVAVWAESVNRFLDGLSRRFEDYSIDILQSHMIEADAARLKSLPTDDAAFELIRRVHLVRNSDLNRVACLFLEENAHTSAGRRAVIVENDIYSPVIYLFCLHPRSVVRNWCQSLIRSSSLDGASAASLPSCVLDEILAILSKDQFEGAKSEPCNAFLYNPAAFWGGLNLLLNTAPEDSHSAIASRLLSSKYGIFLEKILLHSRLAVFTARDSYSNLSVNVPENIFSPTLSCLSWLMLNTSQVFWESKRIVSPAVLADILRKAVLFATRTLEALFDVPYLAVKVIDVIPIFVMSLPEKERQNHIGSSIRFLLQIASNFVTSTQKVVVSLKIHIWSAVLKVVRCSFMMNSSPAVLLCTDVWPEPALEFACSNFSHPSASFLETCSENIRATLVSDATEALKVALRHDIDNLKRVFTDAPLLYATDDRNGQVYVSEALWRHFAAKCQHNVLPAQLFEMVVPAIFRSVSCPPSFVALGFDRPDDVIQAYSFVRVAAQAILCSLSSQSHCRRKFADTEDNVTGLTLLLVSYRDSAAAISDLLRREVQSSLNLSEKPSSVNDCLSLLYEQQRSDFIALFVKCLEFCTKPTVFHCIEKLVKNVDRSSTLAGRFLADLHPTIFWLDRFLHLFSDRSEIASTFDSINIDSLWKLFFLLIVSCVGFHMLAEFDRTFSALFDMGITLLSLKPAFLTSFREFLKSWLSKRELIPSGTRRRWFQFVRCYIRTFRDEKDVVRSVFNKYHGDSLWLYQNGISDQAQRNYLASLVPSLVNEPEPPQQHQLPQTSTQSSKEDGPSSVLANLPSLYSDYRRRDIGGPTRHIVVNSGSAQKTSSNTGAISRSVSMPAGLSRSADIRSFFSDNSNPQRNSSKDDSVSLKTNRLRAGFQSLRDDPELSKHASVIKSISVKPLTTIKSSSALKRRNAAGKPITSAMAPVESVLTVDKLPVRSLGHFLNVILDWSFSAVTGEDLPKQLSGMMMDPLPKTFHSFLEYRKAYGPLLLEETRAMIQNDFESCRDLMPIIVVKHGIDTTPHPSLPGSVLLCTPTDSPDNQRLSESDLLLVWAIADESHRVGPPSYAAFGIVDGQSNPSRLLIRMTRCPATDSRFRNQLAFVRISSLVTAQRMARALESVARLRLGPAVILGQYDSGALEDSLEKDDSTVSGLNSSQTAAIMHCISAKDPVVLLQGPPGTGKSTVIVALIKALLQRSVNKNANQLGQGWRKSTDLDSRHILLCTPSNAAADELTSRLVTASIQAIPESTQYPVIRYGSNVTSDINAESVSLDKLASASHSAQIRPGSQLDGAPSVPLGNDRRSIQELREKLLSEANVIVCTLSGSGATSIGHIPHAFQIVIVDEAAQAHEIETLIPLQYSCRKLILVGDPRQLPATVLSTYAGKRGLNRSMFERLESTIGPVMLTEQYRMHPEICMFPSKQFYHGRVITADINRSVAIHSNPFTKPYLFFDVQSEDIMVNFSRKNVDEAKFVAHLLCHIERTVALYGMAQPSVGVVTPYQAQVQEIRYQASSLLKQPPDVRTIDSFQGQERDIIVISAVRASLQQRDSSKGLGFVADGRRLNVALTRAKLCCLVVGSARTLSESVSIWKDLVANAEQRRCLISVPRINFQEFLQQSHGAARKRIVPNRAVEPIKRPRSMGLRPGFPSNTAARMGSPRLPIPNQFQVPTIPTQHPPDRNYNPVPADRRPGPGRPRLPHFQRGPPSPARRRRAPPVSRGMRATPDPEAIKRLSESSSRLDGRPLMSGRTGPVPPAGARAARAPCDGSAIRQKSTASLGLDDILGTM